jgi:DNA-directed RNA polymerase I subunit RPA2
MDLCWEAEGSGAGRQSISRRMGSLPIMVKSSACYLKGMSRAQLVAAKEESTEFGGYFICNGIERIIRMLILQVCLHLWWVLCPVCVAFARVFLC